MESTPPSPSWSKCLPHGRSSHHHRHVKRLFVLCVWALQSRHVSIGWVSGEIPCRYSINSGHLFALSCAKVLLVYLGSVYSLCPSEKNPRWVQNFCEPCMVVDKRLRLPPSIKACYCRQRWPHWIIWWFWVSIYGYVTKVILYHSKLHYYKYFKFTKQNVTGLLKSPVCMAT